MRMTWIFPLPSLPQSTHLFSHMLKISFNFNFFTSIFKLIQAHFFSNTAAATQMRRANQSPCNFYSYSVSVCYVNRIFQAKQWLFVSPFSSSPLISWNLLPILLTISFLLNPGMFACLFAFISPRLFWPVSWELPLWNTPAADSGTHRNSGLFQQTDCSFGFLFHC